MTVQVVRWTAYDQSHESLCHLCDQQGFFATVETSQQSSYGNKWTVKPLVEYGILNYNAHRKEHSKNYSDQDIKMKNCEMRHVSHKGKNK